MLCARTYTQTNGVAKPLTDQEFLRRDSASGSPDVPPTGHDEPHMIDSTANVGSVNSWIDDPRTMFENLRD